MQRKTDTMKNISLNKIFLLNSFFVSPLSLLFPFDTKIKFFQYILQWETPNKSGSPITTTNQLSQHSTYGDVLLQLIYSHLFINHYTIQRNHYKSRSFSICWKIALPFVKELKLRDASCKVRRSSMWEERESPSTDQQINQ